MPGVGQALVQRTSLVGNGNARNLTRLYNLMTHPGNLRFQKRIMCISNIAMNMVVMNHKNHIHSVELRLPHHRQSSVHARLATL